MMLILCKVSIPRIQIIALATSFFPARGWHLMESNCSLQSLDEFWCDKVSASCICQVQEMLIINNDRKMWNWTCLHKAIVSNKLWPTSVDSSVGGIHTVAVEGKCGHGWRICTPHQWLKILFLTSRIDPIALYLRNAFLNDHIKYEIKTAHHFQHHLM